MQETYDLQRFVEAQASSYATALDELKQGKKQSHWVWYVLPQLRGFGLSANAQFYGIAGAKEAAAYLEHRLLGQRLHECLAAICSHKGKSAQAILGPVDALKFRSCLTLFEAVSQEPQAFTAALQQFFGGVRCEQTLHLLARQAA